jgi:histidine kinase
MLPKKIFAIVLVCIFSANTMAQDKYVDSLLTWIKAHPAIDSLYILTLHRISYRLSEKDVKKSFDYYQQVSALSDSLSFVFGKSLAQINLGILLYSSGNFEASNNAYFKAIDLADSCGALRLKAVAFDDIGDNFKILKDYKKATQYAEAAIAINTKLGAWRGVAINYELLHECALEEKLYDESKDYLLLGMPFALRSNESYILSQFYTGFGKLNAIDNNPDSALFYFAKALDEAKLQNDLRNEHYAYLAQARYMRNIPPDKKIILLDSALNIAKRTSYLDGVSNAAQQLSSVYDDKGNKDSSLYFYRIYRTAADSLFSENNRRNVIIKEAEWMIRKKEVENNDLKELARLQSEEINIKNRLLITTIVSFLLLIIIIFFVNRSIQFKKKREEAAFKQRVAETQMQALKAQINPNFVFNSFNSIEVFSIRNGRQTAGNYFRKLAALINMMLDAGNKDSIPISKDKAALELYIELQQLQHNYKFSYKTSFDRNLMRADCEVPPLLIQPYVENAIMHGIAPSDKKELELSIKARLESGYVIYTIKDNGIGRQKSAILNEQNRSYVAIGGMNITEERINILNHQRHSDGEATVTDLYDEYGKPSGTKVEVKIKAS